MHFKKELGTLVCLFCVFVFLAAADESIAEKQLHSGTTGTMPLLDVKGEPDLTNFIQSACPER